MFTTLHHVRVAAVRSAVPSREIRLDDELEFYGGSAKKVARLKATLGMDRRRVCPDGVTASDLCAHAAEALLRSRPDVRDSVDTLIFVSQSPDWPLPATACELQHRLGLPKSCASFDVNQGCAGYVYGLWLGSSLVAAGAARRVLLLVGDAHSYGRDVRNRITASVFGDGGSATLLERDEHAGPLIFGLGTDGGGFETIIVPAGQARIPFIRDAEKNAPLVESTLDPGGNPWQMCETFMDGGGVFNFTMDVVPDHIGRLLAYAGRRPEDIDWLLLHQANRQIVENLAAKSGFPLEKAPAESFGKYGNTASASIPVAICDRFGGAALSGRALLCGYGVGLAWASCLCDMKDVDCAPVMNFDADPARPTRDDRIKRWQRIFRGEESIRD